MSLGILSLKIFSAVLLTILSNSAVSASISSCSNNDGDELTSGDSSLGAIFATFFTARLFLSK